LDVLSGAPAVEILGLVFRREPGAPFCLNLARFSLAAGERLFLAGKSGSGKSTLLNLIGGAIAPEHGTIRLLGENITRLSSARRDRFRADHMGFIFQQFNLAPYLSAFENALLPCRFSPRRRARAQHPQREVERLFTALDLAPQCWKQQAATLSVGEQQRVAAARALLGRPEILLADEPTSALDAERQLAFLDTLLSEAGQARSALVFASHDRRLAARFHRILDIEHPQGENPEGASG
jgi:putative ABC transport system ATP-binding protein